MEFAAMRTVGKVGRGREAGGAETPEPIRDKLNSIMSIKVIAFADDGGDPDVVPVFGVLFKAPGELRFKVSRYNERIRVLAPGARVAINVLTLDLLTYQLKGTLERFERYMGLEIGVVKIEEAYSCVPPLVAERIV
jgi:hypothetical protein